MRQAILLSAFAGLLAGSAQAANIRAASTVGRAGMAGVPFALQPAVGRSLGQSALQAPLSGLTAVLPRLQTPALAPAAVPQAAILAAPAAEAAPASAMAALQAAQEKASPAAMAEPTPAEAWQRSALTFDGAVIKEGAVSAANFNTDQYRRLGYNEDAKVRAAVRYAADGSEVARTLNDEFRGQGGYFLLDPDRDARYMAAATRDAYQRPVIVLTWDLLNRYNGSYEDVYRGAPWQTIAAVIAREQVFFNSWYSAIPASAEKMAISFMNMVRVFVDLTDGTSRSWATDKDYPSVKGDDRTYVNWNWFEQLVAAAGAAARGVGTNAGHLIDSTFLAWARDVSGRDQRSGYGYTLWEQLDGNYYRPGDPKDGQPLPASAPRIGQAEYDGASYKAYGADGKGSDQRDRLDDSTVFGWIIKWLKDRFEI